MNNYNIESDPRRVNRLLRAMALLSRRGWNLPSMSGALGNGLHESRDCLNKFDGDMDPNLVNGIWSGVFLNDSTLKNAVIKDLGGYSFDDQIRFADTFAKNVIPGLSKSGVFNIRQSDPQNAASDWARYYEKPFTENGDIRAEAARRATAQAVYDWAIGVGKDKVGRAINPYILSDNSGDDLQYERIAGFDEDGNVRTYHPETGFSTRQLVLPEYEVRPEPKELIALRKFKNGKSFMSNMYNRIKPKNYGQPEKKSSKK